MNLEDYLGKPEGQTLEFKGKDAIGNRRTIPRAVCAMANAEGGEIIVGIGEYESGHAVEPTDDFDTAREKIVNRLSDLVEPAPDVQVEELGCREPGCGIRIVVKPTGVLHAYLIEGGYVVWTRFDHRIRRLSWHEVLHRIGGSADQAEAGVEDLIEGWGEEVATNPAIERQGALLFVARVLPTPSELGPEAKAKLARWIEHPEELGLARFEFDYSTKSPPERVMEDGEEYLSSGDSEQGYRHLEVTTSGILRFATRLDLDLVYRGRTWGEELQHAPTLKGRRNRPFLVLQPKPLLGTLRSLTRLHAALVRELAPSATGSVEACCKLIGVRDVRLGRDRFGEANTDNNAQVHEEIFPSGSTLPLTARATITEYVPGEGNEGLGDSLARRLAGKIYNAFLVTDEEVPYYDDRRQRFVLD